MNFYAGLLFGPLLLAGSLVVHLDEPNKGTVVALFLVLPWLIIAFKRARPFALGVFAFQGLAMMVIGTLCGLRKI